MVWKKVKNFIEASVVAVNDDFNNLIRKIQRIRCKRKKIRKEEALIPKASETTEENVSPASEEHMVQEPFELIEEKVSPDSEEYVGQETFELIEEKVSPASEEHVVQEPAEERISPSLEEQMEQELFKPIEERISPSLEEEQVAQESFSADSEERRLNCEITRHMELTTKNIKRLCRRTCLTGENEGGDAGKILLVCEPQGDEEIEVDNNIIGQGAFGTVHTGALYTSVSSTDVAVKSVKFGEQNTSRRSRILRMLENEIQAMIICRDHPNIVKIMFVCFTKSEVLCGMEYASEGDLFGFMENNGELSEYLAKMWFRDIADALLFCHSQGIVHLDVKPENVLIDNFGRAKLADFGISIIAEDPTNPENFKLSGYCTGTWVYLAPEMAKKEVDDTRLCDVWSLGVLLLVMLLGYHPFDESEDLERAWEGEIDFPDDFPTEPMRIIKSALAVDARKRASMEEIVNDKWVTGKSL